MISASNEVTVFSIRNSYVKDEVRYLPTNEIFEMSSIYTPNNPFILVIVKSKRNLRDILHILLV